MAGMVVVSGMVNSMSTYWLEKLTKSYVIIHVLILVSCAIALLVMATPENETDIMSSSSVEREIVSVKAERGM